MKVASTIEDVKYNNKLTDFNPFTIGYLLSSHILKAKEFSKKSLVFRREQGPKSRGLG